MNKSKKQSPKNSPVKLDAKDLKVISGGWGPGSSSGGSGGGVNPIILN
tara:strand:- start:11869 stop:12012 length:144 start_codon:yes stop_codon:yes gene_type:complete